MRLLNLALGLAGMFVSLKPVGHYIMVKYDVNKYKNNIDLFMETLNTEDITTEELIINMNITLTKAKTESIHSQQHADEMFDKAIKAMQKYSGNGSVMDEEEEEDWE